MNPRTQSAVSSMFLAVCPLAFAFFGTEMRDILVNAALLAGFGGALAMISLGLHLKKAYTEKTVARRPKVPFLLGGSVLLGVTFTAMLLNNEAHVITALVQGCVASGLAMLAFGIDPLRNKGLETAADIRQHEAHKLIRVASDHLDQLGQSIGELNDPQLAEQIDGFRKTVALMIRALEDDPDRHRELRKHLSHILGEIVALTRRYATQFRTTQDRALRDAYLTSMAEFEDSFSFEARKFVNGGRDSVEVQLSALKSRMQRKPL
ncbi:5-bromo-4-chloroindolyl phosphate hydrolysis family protein [Roseovarius sp. MBR-6]|jgi:hypothetical protein|uniref:5-bromo-4-chloroindolyl phosphate hydrolysis family protein n=1 Tax=Roseovarius sp. MBR-6 TaxID=3156459 RepID=UPI0033962B83